MQRIVGLLAVLALGATAARATVTMDFQNPSDLNFITYVQSGFSLSPVSALYGPGENTLPPSVPVPQTSDFASISNFGSLTSQDGMLFTLDSIDVAPALPPNEVQGYTLSLSYFTAKREQFVNKNVVYYSASYPDTVGWSTITLPDIKAVEVDLEVYCGIGCGGSAAYIDNLVLTPDEGAPPAPEPSVWILLASGLAAAGAALRHRKSAARAGTWRPRPVATP